MEIIRNLNFRLNNSAVCIGKFDGIHRGHRLLLSEAKKSGLTTVMFTFAMDQGEVLYSEQEKIQLAERLGFDIFIAIPLDEHFMQQSPEDFVRDVLLQCCDAGKVVVGEDFRFGHRRSGDVNLLLQMGIEYGFETVVRKKVVAKGDVISSTRIRALVRRGELEEANSLLGTPYFISGRVQKGNQLGRKLETPTANICPHEGKDLPPYGVYAVLVEVDGKQYKGVANLGKKPTVAEEEPVGLEVWLFDYEGDLYDEEITVYLMDYQREERKFASLEELKQQIDGDARQAKQTLSLLDKGYLARSFRYSD